MPFFNSSVDSISSTAIFTVLSIILAIAATVLAFIFIIPEKRRANLNGFGKLLHDICNFKFMIVEKILQFLYVLATAYAIIAGFFGLFSFNYYMGWTGYIGLLTMILGPVVIRIAYELLMMAIIAIKNIIQINNKLKNQNDGDSKASFGEINLNDYKAPTPVAQVRNFCPSCGAKLDENGICPNCKQL